MDVFLVGEMFAFMKGEEDDLIVDDMAAVGVTVATKVAFVASKNQKDPEWYLGMKKSLSNLIW